MRKCGGSALLNNIRILQLIELDILKEIVTICDANDFKYYIIGGTFLGAIRHKGFIPWDDDIDIAMPRSDFEKFLNIASSKLPEYIKIENFITNPEYQYYITRVQNTNTKIIEKRIGNAQKWTHASVDIFPIDGTPNNKYLRKWHYLKVLTHRMLMSLCYKDSIDRDRKRSFCERLFLKIMENLPIEKFFNANKKKAKIDNFLKKQKVDSSNYVGTIMGAYRTKEIVPKVYFGVGAFYDFEGLKLRGPSMYNEYLTHIYGDYMKIPPTESQKNHYEIVELNGEKI
jgi:lipopolysaccharide cholinephosphotransferase